MIPLKNISCSLVVAFSINGLKAALHSDATPPDTIVFLSKTRKPLSMSGGGENGTAVVFEDGEPMGDVAGVVFARFWCQAKIGG